MGGRTLAAGERVTLMWPAANRDELVFERAEEFCPGRDQGPNLLWGAGIHVCPGAPLARMELRIVLECLLAGTQEWSLVAAAPPTPALYPAAGWAILPIQLS